MGERVMTDEQVIKALSELTYGGHSCIGCTYKVDKGEERCGVKGCNIARCAIDLIKRQQAEIERLEADREALINGQITLQKMYAEAIKKFAERLKDDVANIPAWGSVAAKKIDNLVKELTEGSNGE